MQASPGSRVWLIHSKSISQTLLGLSMLQALYRFSVDYVQTPTHDTRPHVTGPTQEVQFRPRWIRTSTTMESILYHPALYGLSAISDVTSWRPEAPGRHSARMRSDEHAWFVLHSIAIVSRSGGYESICMPFDSCSQVAGCLLLSNMPQWATSGMRYVCSKFSYSLISLL